MRGLVSKPGARLALLAAAATLALGGCSDVDEAMFGPYPGGGQQAAAPPIHSEEGDAQTAAATPEKPAPPSDDTSGAAARDQGDTQTASVAPPEAPPPAAAPPADEGSGGTMAGTLPPAGGYVAAGSSPAIAAIVIQPGRDTGTAVGKMAQSLRQQVAGLNSKLMSNAGRLGELRSNAARATASYQEDRAHIMTRLQAGTTRGNPELVSQWNSAQAALDQIAGIINSLGALGTDVASDAASAHRTLDQITISSDMSGAVDEDHRQLSVLEDETRQMIVSIDRLRKDVATDVPRQTAFVANERANLAQLAGAIKKGELYSSADSGATYASLPADYTAVSTASSDTPLVVIKFDRPDVAYQQILLAAAKQALATKPDVGFEVMGVAPSRGTAVAVARAQKSTRRHTTDVARSLTDMGVPPARVQVASSTDPQALQSEVRVFLR